MELEQFIIVATILFGASMVQSMIGFAFNLIAIPLLVWTGLTLAESVVLTSIPLFIQLGMTAWKLRRFVVWQDLTMPVIIRFITLPIGIGLLYTINSLDPGSVKQIVGLIILSIIIAQLFLKLLPHQLTYFSFERTRRSEM